MIIHPAFQPFCRFKEQSLESSYQNILQCTCYFQLLLTEPFGAVELAKCVNSQDGGGPSD